MSAPSHNEKDPERVAAGLKASIHNPHVSKEAKDSATHRLDEMAGTSTHESKETEHEHHIMAGYKAALKNPNVSKEAKNHAKQALKEHGAL
ncbi:hypothetical protein BDQ12DRAFT_693667 [Crucibulum laeve]|uniref:Conidiation protein 6-domain-containing protein n=1 Tax=Crucibulum laeve TaxID=68775 RepID=A0A5C3LFZ9_9AGAR|nr:hypothetical protein BDQ12DRAFT_693667 [Crucibulum laeve]